MFDTQGYPWSMMDVLAKLPSPHNIQESYTFFATDTNQGYILVIDAYTKRRDWRLMFGNGGGLSFSGGLSLVSDAAASGFLANEIGSVSSGKNPLGYAFPSARTVLAMALNVVVDTSINPTVVAVYKNGIATGITQTIPPGTPAGTKYLVTGSVPFIAGDRVDVGMTNPSTGDRANAVAVTAILDAA